MTSRILIAGISVFGSTRYRLGSSRGVFGIILK
jgi:hypothetical protein